MHPHAGVVTLLCGAVPVRPPTRRGHSGRPFARCREAPSVTPTSPGSTASSTATPSSAPSTLALATRPGPCVSASPASTRRSYRRWPVAIPATSPPPPSTRSTSSASGVARKHRLICMTSLTGPAADIQHRLDACSCLGHRRNCRRAHRPCSLSHPPLLLRTTHAGTDPRGWSNDHALPLKDFINRWVRCVGMTFDDFRPLITAARVDGESPSHG